MQTLTLARHAMATRFELLLHGENPASLRAAGEEALDEIDRLESQLSLYLPTSEISHVNSRAAREPVRVSPNVFQLLEHSRQLTRETNGAFDISLGALVRCWGFMGGAGHMPTGDEIATARQCSGMHLVQLDPENFTVRFTVPGVILDLGAIGKGYAIERAANLLREAGVTSALLHGGTSSIYGLGHPPDAEAWRVTLADPTTAPGAPARQLAIVPLRDEALSVSGLKEHSFQHAGQTFGHVLRRDTAQPAQAVLLAAVAVPSATESDALSTALFINATNVEQFTTLRPNLRAWLLKPSFTQSASPNLLHFSNTQAFPKKV